MAAILKGKEVADALTEKMREEVEALKAKGIGPALGLLRVGERPEDLAYEKGIMKRAASAGVAVKQIVLSPDITQDAFDAVASRVKAITPVPGGVGSVTTSVLIGHVVEAAKRTSSPH